jgi:hypothetical protein
VKAYSGLSLYLSLAQSPKTNRALKQVATMLGA